MERADVRTRAWGTIAFVACAVMLAALTGCSSDAKLARPGILAKWEKEVLKREARGARAIAEEAAGRPECLRDRHRGEWLRELVTEEEAKYAGEPVRMMWKGMDTSRFHRAGGMFLSKYGDMLYSGSDVNVVGCADVPCLYNRIAGKADADDWGYKAYLWYLRTGTAVSAVDFVHDQNSAEHGIYEEAEHALAKYMWKDDEIRGFATIAYTGGEKFRQSRWFERIYRVPQGADIEDEDASVCGLAYSDAHIIVDDGCLWVSGSAGFDGGFFVGVPHEMAHEIDYAMGPQPYHRYARTAAFRDISGWYHDEATDATSGEYQDGWKLREDRTGYEEPVTGYARTSPAEDFADAVAYVRYRGDEAKTRIPRKLALLSTEMFGGRTFDRAGLESFYKTRGQQSIDASLVAMVRDCVSPSAPTPAEVEDVPALELEVQLTPSIRACVERGFERLMRETVAMLKATEYEACDVLSAAKVNELRAFWTAELKDDLTRYLGDQRRVAELARATEDLRTELAAMVDPREAYLNCFRSRNDEGADDARECYERVVGAGFDAVAAGFRDALSETIDMERLRFLAEHTFDQSRIRTTEMYQTMFAGIEPVLRGQARRRWSDCVSAPAGTLDGAVLLTDPFSGHPMTVASQVLNCINTGIEADLDAVRDRYTGGKFEVSNVEARAFLRIQLLLPQYLAMLTVRGQQLAAEEQRRNEEILDRRTAELKSSLLSQKAWIQNAPDEATARSSCMAEGFRRITGQLTGGDDGVGLIFASLPEIERSLAANACREVMRSPQLQGELQAIARRMWDAALAALDRRIEEKAMRQAEVCWTEYPRKTPTHRMGRRRCLRDTWNRYTDSALTEWRANEGARYATRHEEARVRVRNRKEQTLTQLTTRMETLH